MDAAASGGSGTYTYFWTSIPAGFSSTLAKPTATPTVNTTYNVVVNDGFSTVNGQVAVTVNSLPAKPAITASGPTTFCAGGNVTLTSECRNNLFMVNRSDNTEHQCNNIRQLYGPG